MESLLSIAGYDSYPGSSGLDVSLISHLGIFNFFKKIFGLKNIVIQISETIMFETRRKWNKTF